MISKKFKAIGDSQDVAEKLNEAFSEGYTILNTFSSVHGTVFILTKLENGNE